MFKRTVFPVLFIALCLGCKKKETPVHTVIGGGGTTLKDSTNTQQISVLTQHNDNTRAGWNSQETALTPANVNTSTFGKLFSLSVDDQVYSQPLVVGGLNMGSQTRNVVLIATVNNSVYAFDADNGKLFWKNNYTASGMRPPNSADMASSWCSPYTDFKNNIGIVGTPVIDPAGRTIYFVARSTDGKTWVQNLHAVNIVTGSEQPGSPVLLAASVPGTGDGNVNGVVSFDPLHNHQRMGLALVNGVVYISFASHCDWNPYHGWILGYDAKTLQQTNVYNDTPSGENGGIWESGMGIAADGQGNLYVTTGNGTVGQGNLYQTTGNGTDENSPNPNPTDLTNRGNSALKLTPSGKNLQVVSYFTPTNYVDLNVNDLDYGVMGTFLIPNSNYFVTGCKDGNLYLLNKDNMGGYSAAGNTVAQVVPINNSMHCQPSYFKGANGEYIYIWSENDQLKSFTFSNGQFALTPTTSSEAGPGGDCGAELTVSSNGSSNGILWAWYASAGDAGPNVLPGVLRAFDANDVTKELWNSSKVAGDFPGNYAKYCCPTVANGKVYVGTFSNQVIVYGLKSNFH